MNRNILIHDYFENFGGGERLVLSINKLFPELITSFINEDIKKKIKFSKVNLIDDSKLSILKKINLINNFKNWISKIVIIYYVQEIIQFLLIKKQK